MDTFDLSFLLLRNKAHGFPFHDCTCLAMKSEKDVQAWGPEARLMADIIIGAWKRKSKVFLKELQSCFQIEPTIKINNKKIEKLFKQHKNVGKETWAVVEKKVRSIMSTATTRALDHFVTQAKQQQKTKKSELDREARFAEFIAKALSDQVQNFVERYPEVQLHPEIIRLAQYIRTSERTGIFDKYNVSRRLDAIADKGESYFEGLTDVEVGNAWTATGIELAYRNGATEYRIIAQIDDPNKPCPVCLAEHGKTFSVAQAREKVNHLMSLNGTEDFSKEYKFVEVDDIKNLSREEFYARGDHPPFHNSCRCDVVIAWESIEVDVEKFFPAQQKRKQVNIKEISVKDFGKDRIKPGTVEDSYLKKLFEKQEFDKKPVLNTEKELADKIASGDYLELYRGVMNTKYIEKFKTGDNFAGTGIYGNGTYTAYGKDALDTALSYGLRKNQNIIHMAVPKNIKSISWDNIQSLSRDTQKNPLLRQAAYLEKTAKGKKKILRQIELLNSIGREPGSLATFLGYQAIDVPHEEFMVILDRSAVVVQQ